MTINIGHFKSQKKTNNVSTDNLQIKMSDFTEISIAKFLSILRENYCKAPFRISGFAFWKTEKAIEDGRAFFCTGEGIRAYVKKNNKLYSYLSDDDNLLLHSNDDLASFDLLNLHSRYKDHLTPLKSTHEFNSFHPLCYTDNKPKQREFPEGIAIRSLDPYSEPDIKSIAGVISKSSGRMLPPGRVRTWTEIPVFDPDLWIAATDVDSDEVVGIGISTYNQIIKETDLDWFYTLPEYWHRGIGSLLVDETIIRSFSKSDIIRVAGLADNFYERCGFEKKDEWLFITRKGMTVSWW